MDRSYFIQKYNLRGYSFLDLPSDVKMRDVININCEQHGIYTQLVKNTIKSRSSGRSGCKKCGYNSTKEQNKNSLVEFKSKANEKHKNRYDYSLIDNASYRSIAKIICPTHGIFEQLISNHMLGHGCRVCSDQKVTMCDFIERSKLIHHNNFKYDYVKYINSYTKIIITCIKHGNFKQRPYSHLEGYNGCKKCNTSFGEYSIMRYLDMYNIKYLFQYKLEGLLNLSFDFYLPEYDILIEYDGEQHFKEIKAWGGKEKFEKNVLNDNIKNSFCTENNKKLLRISYLDDIIQKLDEYFRTYKTIKYKA